MKGTIWIKAALNKQHVEIVLGNGGSWISPQARSKIFDAFYTQGKAGGTGLGLAITQKVVAEHGGKIICRSEKTAEWPQGLVEFVITLPSAVQKTN